MAIGAPIALLDALFGSGHRNWPNPFGGTQVTALGSAWRAVVLAVTAYVVLFRFLPFVLRALAWLAFPQEARDYITEIGTAAESIWEAPRTTVPEPYPDPDERAAS